MFGNIMGILWEQIGILTGNTAQIRPLLAKWSPFMTAFPHLFLCLQEGTQKTTGFIGDHRNP
jgi:hypothetical protein